MTGSGGRHDVGHQKDNDNEDGCSAWRHKIAGRDVCAQALKYSSASARRWQRDSRAIDCISILSLLANGRSASFLMFVSMC